MDKFTRQMLPFASLILLISLIAALAPDNFLTASNFMNVLRRSSVNGIIAIGMTAIIISGGIDLSVGSLLALSGMSGALVMLHVPGPLGMLLGTLAGITTGALCGALNGLAISKLSLPPFIVTLGAMSAFRGVAYVMNDGQPYNVPDYRYLGEGELLGMPVSALIFVAVIAVAAFALRSTRLGRYAYAIGSNREAAYHSGVNVGLCSASYYALTGLATGLAAMIATSRTVSAQPTAGISLELDTIAAVVIGGASLSGGRGTVMGTIIGTLLISFLRNGCTLLGVSTNVQLIVIGAIIVAAVSADRFSQGRTGAD